MKKCKSCQTEIDAKATKCPHCQADQRGWVARHKVLTGIGVVIVFFIVIIASGSKSTSSTSSASGTASNSESQTQASAAPAVKQAKIGDTVTDGDLAFTAQAITSSHTLGDSYSLKTAQGLFYIVTVKIQNNGKDTKTIDSSDFHVTDSQGRKFDNSSDGQMAILTTENSSSLFLQQVQPGLSVTGKIVFDVPADAAGLKLLAQGGLFSDPVSIDLGK